MRLCLTNYKAFHHLVPSLMPPVTALPVSLPVAVVPTSLQCVLTATHSPHPAHEQGPCPTFHLNNASHPTTPSLKLARCRHTLLRSSPSRTSLANGTSTAYSQHCQSSHRHLLASLEILVVDLCPTTASARTLLAWATRAAIQGRALWSEMDRVLSWPFQDNRRRQLYHRHRSGHRGEVPIIGGPRAAAETRQGAAVIYGDERLGE